MWRKTSKPLFAAPRQKGPALTSCLDKAHMASEAFYSASRLGMSVAMSFLWLIIICSETNLARRNLPLTYLKGLKVGLALTTHTRWSDQVPGIFDCATTCSGR